MVVEVLVAQGQAVDPLGEQFLDGVLDEVGVAVVGEAGGELADDPGESLGLAEQQGAAVGGDVAAVEVGEDFAGAEHGKVEVGRRYTLWSSGCLGLGAVDGCRNSTYDTARQPDSIPLVKKSGLVARGSTPCAQGYEDLNDHNALRRDLARQSSARPTQPFGGVILYTYDALRESSRWQRV